MSNNVIWIVGATYDSGDQFPRFIEQGVWENGYTDKHLDLVKSIQVGDAVAIKSTYVRKKNLPFDNRNQSVSVMAIKAVGTVTENMNDGRLLKVDWTQLSEPKEWYFYTLRKTIWKVTPSSWEKENLLSFVLDDVPQDIDRFRNAPYWKERFGDAPEKTEQFKWTRFYEEVADHLRAYRKDRSPLVEELHRIASELNVLSNLNDQFSDGSSGPLQDICPFTFMGTFNRGFTDANRTMIATALAEFFGIKESVPDTFEGIPVLNNQKSWLFGYEKDRNPEDIDLLWDVFEKAIELAGEGDDSSEVEFIEAYKKAAACKQVGWNLTMGLYWIRPWVFPTLDGQSRPFIQDQLHMDLKASAPNKRCSAEEYLELKAQLEDKFKTADFAVHSFPELSLAAWNFRSSEPEVSSDPCPRDKIMNPTNSILYGPPGTGKTYYSVNHALAICERQSIDDYRDETREAIQGRFRALQEAGQIAFVTFHQSMGYEDFVEGIKPQTADEGVSYSVTPGIFLELCERARDNWESSKCSSSNSFDRVWAKFTSPLKQNEEGSLDVKTKRGAFNIYEINERAVYFEKQNGSRTHSLSVKTLKRLFRNPEQLMALGGLQTYYRGLVGALKQVQTDGQAQEKEKQFVLIIDEINRGNVSAVLGELITLLEPDKRLGMENELRATLPYSQDSDFGVPPNLHIVGTMNTADRSVEALDTALRRRFTFEEMMPEPALLNEVDGVDLTGMLTAINQRLEVLVGRDHTIGHAFFMRVENLEDLRAVFHSKVIPQLQEYFYGDWEKINQILGNAFVACRANGNAVSWPKGSDAPDDAADRKIWKITPQSDWHAGAFKSIYGAE